MCSLLDAPFGQNSPQLDQKLQVLLFPASLALLADVSGVVVSAPDIVLMRLFTSPQASLLSAIRFVFVTVTRQAGVRIRCYEDCRR
jgi:hypothetical protein